ncbi:hypothetical protein CARUB_v10006238mg, partial [Capsella rubella]
MASSSLTQVYLSFHGPDLPRVFLNHLHDHFARKGMTTFKEVKTGQTIGPESLKAIRESRVSIVVLSKNYISSRWCLDELVEIFKCNEASGQMIGEFGRCFIERTCQGETEEVKKRWSSALAHVGSLRGDYSLFWDDDAAMVGNIAARVSRILK